MRYVPVPSDMFSSWVIFRAPLPKSTAVYCICKWLRNTQTGALFLHEFCSTSLFGNVSFLDMC